MSRKIWLLNIIILFVVFSAVPASFVLAFSKAIEENGKSYIVDLHGERWDVTQARSLGFDPERFRHGIGRNAFTPLDDSHLKDKNPDVASSTRVIGISDGKEARAYSVPRLYRHEVANSSIGDQPIAAAY